MKRLLLIMIIASSGLALQAQGQSWKVLVDKKVLLEAKAEGSDLRENIINLSKSKLKKAKLFTIVFEGSGSEWKRRIWLADSSDQERKSYIMPKADGTIKIPIADVRKYLQKDGSLKIWTIMAPPPDVAMRVRLRSFFVCKIIVE